MGNDTVADAIFTGHMVLLGALTVAPFVLNKPWLERYQYVPPLLATAWVLDGGRCVLSDLEYKVRGRPYGENFYQSVARKAGGKLTVRQSNIIGYGMLAVGVIITKIRLSRP